MDRQLKELLAKYNAEVDFADISKKGYLLRGVNKKPNIIIVSSSLSDEEAEKVIIHELGHLKYDDKGLATKYKENTIARLDCEHGANSYLIKEQVKRYALQGNDIEETNYVNFADSIGITDYMKVKEELTKYITKNDSPQRQ